MYRRKLLEIGIPADINGFEYLNYALEKYQPGQRMMALYDDIAIKFNTTPSRAERNIRHAIIKTGEDLPSGSFIAKYKILWGDEKQ